MCRTSPRSDIVDGSTERRAIASALLDEMHAPAVAVELRARGFDVVAVKERPALVGRSDPEVLVAATAEGRALVTENRARQPGP